MIRFTIDNSIDLVILPKLSTGIWLSRTQTVSFDPLGQPSKVTSSVRLDSFQVDSKSKFSRLVLLRRTPNLSQRWIVSLGEKQENFLLNFFALQDLSKLSLKFSVETLCSLFFVVIFSSSWSSSNSRVSTSVQPKKNSSFRVSFVLSKIVRPPQVGRVSESQFFTKTQKSDLQDVRSQPELRRRAPRVPTLHGVPRTRRHQLLPLLLRVPGKPGSPI